MTQRTTPRPVPLLAAAALLGAHAEPASAQIQASDLFLVHNASGLDSSLVQYSADGSVVHTLDALSTDRYIAATLTPDGHFAINRGGNGVEIRAYDGTVLQDFDTQYTYGSGQDLAVFDDGTVAICARQHGIMLYTQAGVWIGGFAGPDIYYAQGCYRAADDTLWVADAGPDVDHNYRVIQFDRAGDVLTLFELDYAPSDVVEAGDGTLWVSALHEGRIAQYTRDGIELRSFDVQFDTAQETLWSLALLPTGGIVAIGEFDTTVRTYSTDGVVLDEFGVTAAGNPRYLFTLGAGGTGGRYCFGDGTGKVCPCANFGGLEEGCQNSTGAGGTLFGLGSASVSLDVLTFQAEQLPPGQPALLFCGDNDPGDGLGIVFGDGLRCAGMNVVRLGIETPDVNGAAAWGPGLAQQAGWSSGDVSYVQVWYRDPNNGPCGTGFNLTNGVQLELYD